MLAMLLILRPFLGGNTGKAQAPHHSYSSILHNWRQARGSYLGKWVSNTRFHLDVTASERGPVFASWIGGLTSSKADPHAWRFWPLLFDEELVPVACTSKMSRLTTCYIGLPLKITCNFQPGAKYSCSFLTTWVGKAVGSMFHFAWTCTLAAYFCPHFKVRLLAV